jgi:hypothetical protein
MKVLLLLSISQHWHPVVILPFLLFKAETDCSCDICQSSVTPLLEIHHVSLIQAQWVPSLNAVSSLVSVRILICSLASDTLHAVITETYI